MLESIHTNLIYLVHRGTAETELLLGVNLTIILLLRQTTIRSTTSVLMVAPYLCGANLFKGDVRKMSKEEQKIYIISLLDQLGLVASKEEAQPAPEDDLYSPETVHRE